MFFSLSPLPLKNLDQVTIQNLITTVQITLPNDSTVAIVPSSQISVQFYPNLATNQIEMIIVYNQASIENTQLTFQTQPSNVPTIPSIMHLPTIDYTIPINSGGSATPFYSYNPQVYDEKIRFPIKIMSQRFH